MAAGRKTLHNQLVFGPQPHNEPHMTQQPGLGTREAGEAGNHIMRGAASKYMAANAGRQLGP